MRSFLTLDDLDAAGKTILLRADLNVPMQDGRVTDKTRIIRLIPTLKELSKAGAKIVILSHFGRPRGRDPSMSLAPISDVLTAETGQHVAFAPDCVGEIAQAAVNRLKAGELLLLENARFYGEEEANDKTFAQNIAKLGDAYVNDAFSCAHRAHATTQGIAAFLPSYAGRMMEAELDALERVLEKPRRPVAAIVGGAKISTKLDLLKNLVTKLDLLVLGGGMANTFLSAQGNPVGKSLCEREMKQQALQIMEIAAKHKCPILLPVDAVIATELRRNARIEIRHVEAIREEEMMLDIGPETIEEIEKALSGMKTVLWNGPMGAFETPPFDQGTDAVAMAVASLTQKNGLISIAGGGDTAAALAHAGVEGYMTYLSTAGGAFLEWLEGKTLPGVKILQDKAAAQRLLTSQKTTAAV